MPTFPPVQAAEFMTDALEIHEAHPPFLYAPTTQIIAAKPQPLRVAWDVFKTSFSDTGRPSTSLSDTAVGRHAVVEHKGLSAKWPRIPPYPAPFEYDALSSTKAAVGATCHTRGSAGKEMPRYRRQVVGLISKFLRI
jgi:hypothetical protein